MNERMNECGVSLNNSGISKPWADPVLLIVIEGNSHSPSSNHISSSIRQNASPTLARDKRGGCLWKVRRVTLGLSAPAYPQEAEHGPVSTMWVKKPQKAGSVPRLEPQEPYRNHIRATTAPPAHKDFRCCRSQAKASTDLLTGVLRWLSQRLLPNPIFKPPGVLLLWFRTHSPLVQG